MSETELIKQDLETRFAYLKDAVIVKREARIFVNLSLDKFEEVFDFFVKNAGFDALSAITGIDTGSGFGVIYHINKENKIMLSLEVALDRNNPEVNTITAHFAGADIFEREIIDLFGIQVKGLKDGYRYPLPDNWPKDEHPLRKDWKGSLPKEVPNA